MLEKTKTMIYNNMTIFDNFIFFIYTAFDKLINAEDE